MLTTGEGLGQPVEGPDSPMSGSGCGQPVEGPDSHMSRSGCGSKLFATHNSLYYQQEALYNSLDIWLGVGGEEGAGYMGIWGNVRVGGGGGEEEGERGGEEERGEGVVIAGLSEGGDFSPKPSG